MTLTDERYKELMKQVGLPNSRSLLITLKQVVNEVSQAYEARLASEAPDNWIPVSERLPDIKGLYVVYIPLAYGCEINKWNGDKFSGEVFGYKATHWMPVPKPPTGEDDEET